jgi:hypothetical protein
LPLIFPVVVTVIAPPLLKIGPLTLVEMVWLLITFLLRIPENWSLRST